MIEARKRASSAMAPTFWSGRPMLSRLELPDAASPGAPLSPMLADPYCSCDKGQAS